jgi:uncharacterized protein
MKNLSIALVFAVILVGCKSYSDGEKNLNDVIEASKKPHDMVPGFKGQNGILVDYPTAIGFVNDFARLFTNEQIHRLDSIIIQHEKATTNQIAIVTFDTIPIEKTEFDDFTLALANYWGVGQKEKNNGVLIALCTTMKKIQIQNGRGVEKIISDSTTKKIIDEEMLLPFKQENYYQSSLQGLTAIIKKLQ